MSLLSGTIGIPDGAYTLLQKSDLERAVGFVLQNQTKIEQIIIEGVDSSGEATPSIGGVIDDDGTILVDSGLASAQNIAEGQYYVDVDDAYQSSGGQPQFWCQVTPMGTLPDPGEFSFADYLGLTTVSVDQSLSGVQFDPVQGKAWATDSSHNELSSDSTDRLGVLRLDTATWEYIYLPTDWSDIGANKCSALVIDVVKRVAYVQALGTPGTNDAKVTTLIYSLDTLELLMNTYDDLTHTSSFALFVVGHDAANNRILLWDDADMRLHQAVDGVVSTGIDTLPRSGFNIGFRYAVTDAQGQFWFHDSTPNPDDWRVFYVSGSTLLSKNVDGGASGNSTRIHAYNSTTDEIYYMSSNLDELWKVDCATEVCAQVNTGTYATKIEANRATTLIGINALIWSFDNYRLLAIDGGGSGLYDAYIVDPTDGTVEFHSDVPDLYTVQYATDTVSVDSGRLFSLGSNRIQVMDFTGGQAGDADSVLVPVSVAWTPVSTTRAYVEFRRTSNNAIRQNSAFSITFHGVEA